MTKETRPITNGIVATLVASAIISIVQWLVPGGWVSVFTTAKGFVTTILAWLGSTFSMPTWLAIFLAGIVIVVILLGGLFVAAAAKKQDDDLPTEIEYLGVKWRWRYGRTKIDNVVPFCMRCDLQVHPTDASNYRFIPRTIYKCEDCHWSSQEFECTHEELVDRVIRKIQQELRLRLNAKSQTKG